MIKFEGLDWPIGKWKAFTYYVSYCRLNDPSVEASVVERISVVRLLKQAIWIIKLFGLSRFLAYLKAPPISTRPSGDIQLEWLTLASVRLWEWSQTPVEERTTQLLAVASVFIWPPPQLRRPSCVWPTRGAGRSGMKHGCGTPNDDKTSTDESSCPPVTIITKMV